MSSSSDDSPINHHHHQQSPDSDSDSTLQSSSKSYALSGRIMLASISILFIVVIFLVFLHLYARWFLLRRRNNRHNHHRHHRRNRSTRIVFYVDNNPSPPSTIGLDPSVIKSLPIFVFSSETDGKIDGKVDGKTPECAVCLSEFETGETGRVLPKCKHSFHTECIDMWFFNNSTCPLCRTTVEANVETTSFVKSGVPEPGLSGLNLSSGNMSVQTTTTSFSDRMKRVSDVRIDVPNRNELVGELGMTSSPSQGFRSPGGRLLTRIINMSRRSPAVSPSSGGGGSGSGCVVVPVGAAAELDIESASQESNGVGSFR